MTVIGAVAKPSFALVAGDGAISGPSFQWPPPTAVKVGTSPDNRVAFGVAGLLHCYARAGGLALITDEVQRLLSTRSAPPTLDAFRRFLQAQIGESFRRAVEINHQPISITVALRERRAFRIGEVVRSRDGWSVFYPARRVHLTGSGGKRIDVTAIEKQIAAVDSIDDVAATLACALFDAIAVSPNDECGPPVTVAIVDAAGSRILRRFDTRPEIAHSAS